MKPILLLFLLWTVAWGGPALAVEFSAARIGGSRVTVCRVNVTKERLQLFWRDDAGQPLKSFKRVGQLVRAHGGKLTFAMNAGMYQVGGFAPVGLFVNDGQELAPLNTASGYGNFFLKPNGVFLVSDQGARVIETSEYPHLRERVLLATQSGPLLVRSGRIHPVFNPTSTSRLLRNGVGVPSSDVALFAIADDPVNFYEFATFFRDVLHCPDALFLDGTVSSLHSPALHRSDVKIDLGPIIGVVE